MTDRLLREIEYALKRKMQTPKDFDFLRERIFARQNVLVSSTTLKRLWGYLHEDVEPREGTLSVLAQFLGYEDWTDYKQKALDTDRTPSSSPVMSRKLNAESLRRGERLVLTWQPERVCEVEYLGDRTFRVVRSEKTRLKAGDTFECSMIIEGEPLYLNNLCQDGVKGMAYVCGKRNGVKWEKV